MAKNEYGTESHRNGAIGHLSKSEKLLREIMKVMGETNNLVYIHRSMLHGRAVLKKAYFES